MTMQMPILDLPIIWIKILECDFSVHVLVYKSQTCLMWPSKGTVKYGHIRQVVTYNTGLIDMNYTVKGNKN